MLAREVTNEVIALNLMQGFATTDNDHLSLHGVDLDSLCDKYDTPLFVFDEERFRENYQRFYQAFEKYYPKTIVCFSLKTNYNLALCRIMQEEGAHAEVASGLDLHVAKKAGFPPDRIIFDGLYKPEAVLRQAVDYKVLLINVESLSELELLDKIAGEIGQKQTVGIRLRTLPHRLLDSEIIYCNAPSRFGFSYEDAYMVFKEAPKLDNLEVKGIMIHPYWGIHEFLPFVKRIQDELGVKIQYINFGGGYEKGSRQIGLPDLVKDAIRQKLGFKSKLDSSKEKKYRPIEESARLITEEVKQTLGNSDATLIFEPGRYIVHDAGILVLRVRLVKKAAGFKWIVVDGGTNLNYNWLERREIRLVNHVSASPVETVNVVGPLLYARDFVTIKQRLPKLQEGDLLAVFNSGAYTLSNSTQFLHPRPGAVLIRKDGCVTKIRERENYDDVLRMDRHEVARM